MNKPILIRVSELIDFQRATEEPGKKGFLLSILKTGLTDNLLDKIPVKKSKTINDTYVKFRNTEQTRATIELLKEHEFFTNNKSIIIPGE